jgi:hypothetical protein
VTCSVANGQPVVAASVLGMALAIGASASAQPAEPSIQLVITAGTPLRVALDRRITVKRVGQPVTAMLIEPAFAYDRIVLPAGTKVVGRIEKIERVARSVRLRAMLSGDFSPSRHVMVQFHSLVLPEVAIPIHTSATEGTQRVVLKIAGTSKDRSIAAGARQEIAGHARQAASVVTAPGKLERLKDVAIGALPYHPQILRKGTVYSARLLAPLSFGSATPLQRAPVGATPAPQSILNARLDTGVGSVRSPTGTHVEAVLTQPVFSADHQLILPEGTRLKGEVTFSRRARRFHRHAQMRFLFETVHPPNRLQESLRASLYSVEADNADHVTLDDEGGATSTSSKARFAAPALAALAFAGTMHGRLDYDTDGAPPEMQYGGVGSSMVGGFLGFGVFGVAVNQLGRPFMVATGAVGLARTVYAAVFAKGREISFPADTSIQIQLAPGPSPVKR